MGLSFKTKFILFSFISCLGLLTQCNSSNEQELKRASEVEDSVNCDTKSLNPNGDSELALLMRAMMKNSDSLRMQVMQGKLPEKFPEMFLSIHTAKPTDSETKKASFNAYADNYISMLQKLYQSDSKNLNENYNAVIEACASCHSEHCPGPLKAINKLKLSSE